MAENLLLEIFLHSSLNVPAFRMARRWEALRFHREVI